MKVTEVAHDYHVGVMKYVTEELGILNSYDTWHGEHYYLLYSELGYTHGRYEECSQGYEESWPGQGEGRGQSVVYTTS